VSEEEWNGDEWVAGGGFQIGARVSCRFTGLWCTVHASKELDGVDGVSGWRCEPSPDVGVAVSVAQRLGLGRLEFSPGASESRPAWVGRSARGHGESGLASRAGRRARSCEARERRMRVCTGMCHLLYAGWAARSCWSGTVGVTRSVGFGRGWFGQLIQWVEASLAAR
jgi:hypothetical protein